MKNLQQIKSIGLVFLVGIMSFNLSAATIYSNSSTGNDAGAGTSVSPYKTFHKAYTMASSGDIIDLTGTFTWTDADETGDVSTTYTTNGYPLTKSLTIRGQGADNTFIQAASTADVADRRVFCISGSSTVVTIEDLTMRYGKVSGAVYGNYYNQGGGVYITAATVNITGCNIEYNVLYGNNYGKTQGGGIYVYSSNPMTLEDCNIRYNEISAGAINNYGSAICLDHGTTHIINNCTINNNTAPGNIAAIYGYYGSVKLTNSTICYNNDAGFENLFGSTTSYFTNCVFANNRGNGLNGGSTCSYYFKNCIFANNLGSYDFYPSSVTIYNNGYNIIETYSSFTPAASDITGNQANLFGTGISATPALAKNNSNNNTFTLALSSGSVAIDAGATGTNGSVSVPSTDQRGWSRQGSTDIGAFEHVAYTWEGGTSTDFNTAGNWAENSIPINYADIIFASSPSNHCILDANRTIGNITNTQSTYGLQVNGKTITINGDISLTNGAEIDASAASSIVKFGGSSAQSIPADAFTSDAVKYLTIDNASGVTLNGDLTVDNDLTINSGKVLNIAPGKTLTVTGTTTNSAGNTGIVVKSDATGTGSFISSTSSIGGTVESFQTYDKYHYYSTPVTSTSYPFGANYNNTYYWSESTQAWVRQFASLTTGKGYTAYPINSDQTLSVAGSLNTGTITHGITYTGSGASEGWELIGNPYPCGISISAFTGNATNTGLITGTVYLFEYYDATSAGAATYSQQDYLTANSTGLLSNSRVNTTSALTTIAPNQGFFVRTTSAGSIQFTDAMKSASSHKFYVPDPVPVQRVYMSVKDEKGNSNNILIGFTSEATLGFDRMYDGQKLQGNSELALYSFIGDEKMAIQGLPLVEKQYLIPIGLHAGIGGEYVFSLDTLENFDPNVKMYLFDAQEDDLTLLNIKTTYTFDALEGEIDNRFFIIFKEDKTSSATEIIDKQEVNAWTLKNNLIIDLPVLDNYEINVYDIQGKTLLNKKINGIGNQIITELPNTGVYIVYVNNQKTTFISKVIVSQ